MSYINEFGVSLCVGFIKHMPDRTATHLTINEDGSEQIYFSLDFRSVYNLGDWDDSDYSSESELKKYYKHVINLDQLKAELIENDIIWRN